jgi:hypothetical protein
VVRIAIRIGRSAAYSGDTGNRSIRTNPGHYDEYWTER